MARLTLHYHNYHKEKLRVHADCMGYVIIKVVLFHAFHSLFSICCWLGIVWHAYWHSSTWENHQNSQIQNFNTHNDKSMVKHRLWRYPSISTFNNIFISRFHVNPKLTAKILSSRWAVMSTLALPPCWSWKMLHTIGTHTMSLPSPSPAQLWGKKWRPLIIDPGHQDQWSININYFKIIFRQWL